MDVEVWAPASVVQAAEMFGDADFRWWISGGLALEEFVNRSWREHSDTDVGLTRRDLPQLASVLQGWELFVSSGGSLRQWRGAPLRLDRNENNLWCRRSPSDPWALDITINEGDADEWVFRRDPTITLSWPDAVLHDGAHHVPYVAPEIQLLFKGRDPRPKDDDDARVVIPELGRGQRERLRRWLPANHRWQGLIASSSDA
jgi:Aminoglycoside-2''-adenylyltransferase